MLGIPHQYRYNVVQKGSQSHLTSPEVQWQRHKIEGDPGLNGVTREGDDGRSKSDILLRTAPGVVDMCMHWIVGGIGLCRNRYRCAKVVCAEERL